jgi:ribosomal protein S18 acetylase RimI-like enzyme
MTQKIRRYEDRDFAEYASTLEKTTSWGKEARDELGAMLAKANKEQIWVAEVDRRAVGFMILTLNDDDSLEVDWLDVHPSFQSMGVGTLLVKKAVKIAKARKMQALSVHTWPTNEKMINFSSKNGFEIFERITNFYGKRKDAIRLKKRISKE